MENFAIIFCTLFFNVILVLVTCHPEGELHQPVSISRSGAYTYEEAHQRTKRALDICLNSEGSHILHKRAAERRAAFFRSIQSQVELKRDKRDAATVLNKSHHSSVTNLTIDSNPFFSTAACVLSPEVTMGPYWVQGELVRSDLRETQVGIDLYLDIQLIDVNTCQPLDKVHLDIWHCNATGIYSGVAGEGTLDETFFRGVVATSNNGVAQLVTKFPGHYSARTSHIHVITHLKGSVLRNGTYSGGSIPHIGEIFFDQGLLAQVRALPPYSQNPKKFKLNREDRYFNTSSVGNADPVLNYVFLGDSATDGILGWITMGVNKTVDHSDVALPASMWTKDGGLDLQLGDRWRSKP